MTRCLEAKWWLEALRHDGSVGSKSELPNLDLEGLPLTLFSPPHCTAHPYTLPVHHRLQEATQ